MIKPITSLIRTQSAYMDGTVYANRANTVREITGENIFYKPSTGPIDSDLYITSKKIPEHLLALHQDRPSDRSILGRQTPDKISYLHVQVDGDPIRVEVKDSNPVFIPSEIRTKEVIAEIMPSVVSISVTGTTLNEETGEKEKAGWLGSGFVVDPEDLCLQGYEPEIGEVLIATNHHVADGAETVDVELFDGSEYFSKARVLVSDEELDIAILVLKIGTDTIPPAPIGTPDDTAQGEFVLAFGSPYGLPFRVTRGIVNNAWFDEEGVIQTDAAINPGNSGGPLVDLSTGNVVGMNTFTYRGSNSMGFAMPIWLQFQKLREVWNEENWSWNANMSQVS